MPSPARAERGKIQQLLCSFFYKPAREFCPKVLPFPSRAQPDVLPPFFRSFEHHGKILPSSPAEKAGLAAGDGRPCLAKGESAASGAPYPENGGGS
ncbi:MAG: hypothetical protein CW346_17165, partial [Bacillaceae bacterium]|nr:hypothetical protein [Bacillaceae bacterium]